MKRMACFACRRALNNTEIALNLKLQGRAASRFFCLSDLARRTGSTEGSLMAMAEFFRDSGCELFSREYVEEGRDETDVRMAVDERT